MLTPSLSWVCGALILSALCCYRWGIADLMTGFRHKLGLPLLSTNNTGLALYRCVHSSCCWVSLPPWSCYTVCGGMVMLYCTAWRAASPCFCHVNMLECRVISLVW